MPSGAQLEPVGSGSQAQVVDKHFDLDGKRTVTERADRTIDNRPIKIGGVAVCRKLPGREPELLLVREMDSPGYWKILAEDLNTSNSQAANSFKNNYEHRARNIDHARLDAMIGWSFHEFGRFVAIYRQCEKGTQDCPAWGEVIKTMNEREEINPFNFEGLPQDKQIDEELWEKFRKVAREERQKPKKPVLRWGLPKGALEPGDKTSRECAAREFNEETGLSAADDTEYVEQPKEVCPMRMCVAGMSGVSGAQRGCIRLSAHLIIVLSLYFSFTTLPFFSPKAKSIAFITERGRHAQDKWWVYHVALWQGAHHDDDFKPVNNNSEISLCGWFSSSRMKEVSEQGGKIISEFALYHILDEVKQHTGRLFT